MSRTWRAPEEAQLETLVRDGSSLYSIGARLDRSPRNIMRQISRLGLLELYFDLEPFRLKEARMLDLHNPVQQYETLKRRSGLKPQDTPSTPDATPEEEFAPEVLALLEEVQRDLPTEPAPVEYMDGVRKNYPRAYLPWGEPEDRLLRLLVQQGKRPDELKTLLLRHRGSIKVRIKELALDEAKPVKKPVANDALAPRPAPTTAVKATNPSLAAFIREVQQDLPTEAASDERVQKLRETHPRAYLPWSEREDQLVQMLAERGDSKGDIQNVLMRQEGAITSRLKKLALREEASESGVPAEMTWSQFEEDLPPPPPSQVLPPEMAGQTLEQTLRQDFGLEQFKPGQQEALEVALRGERLLLIQPTGWGKSLVYQMLARFAGLTLVFSPLRALMRDQVLACERYGLRAEAVHSDRKELENKEILEAAVAGRYNLLFIAPERLQNPTWQGYAQRLPVRAVVIDEAHCISIWGHDFRPHYGRIVDFTRHLPEGVPIVATTATATPQVEEDIRRQMGAGIRVLRGSLFRPNLRLRIIPVTTQAEKLAWLAHLLPQFPGNGIVYTALRKTTEGVTTFLEQRGIHGAYYHAGRTREERQAIEEGFMGDAYKVITSTNALGMGIDKPNIRFVMHTEHPASLLDYYQQIGRAGRNGQEAGIILFYHPDDAEVQRGFIETHRLTPETYERAQALLQGHPRRFKELQEALELPWNTALRLLEELRYQGLVKKEKEHYHALPGATVDTGLGEVLTQVRHQELEHLLYFISSADCRMQRLCRHLGDLSAPVCGKCDNCRGNPLPPPPAELIAEAERFYLQQQAE